MNLKKIGIYAGIFAGTFLLMVIVAYFLYPVLNEEEVMVIEAQQEAEIHDNLSLSDASVPVEVTEREMQENDDAAENSGETGGEDMENPGLPDFREPALSGYEQTIDSLYQEMEKMREEFEQQLAEERRKKQNEDLEDAAKTLLNLDEEVLAPIANRLTHQQLVKLYRAATNMQREKLLGALEPEKASQILKEVIL